VLITVNIELPNESRMVADAGGHLPILVAG
jgi:hypothetical protein